MNTLEYENYQEKIKHGDMVFPYNIYLCSIPLDFANVPLHWHDELELIYIKKGKGKVTIDFLSYLVTAPSLVIVLPGQLHSIDQYEEDCMEYENIIFDTSLLLSKQNDSGNVNFLLPLFSGQISVPTLFSEKNAFWTQIIAPIDACDEICKEKPSGYELYIRGQLHLFFFSIIQHYGISSPSDTNRKNLEKLKVVIKYVENNYAEKIFLRDVAAAIDYSESHFMRFFKATIGQSFVEYLRDYRLSRAAHLLNISDDSILDIAAKTGFDNLSYFNRSFKSKYHMTPSCFRNKTSKSAT